MGERFVGFRAEDINESNQGTEVSIVPTFGGGRAVRFVIEGEEDVTSAVIADVDALELIDFVRDELVEPMPLDAEVGARAPIDGSSAPRAALNMAADALMFDQYIDRFPLTVEVADNLSRLLAAYIKAKR